MKSHYPITAVLAAVILLSSSAYADRGGHARGGYYPSRHAPISHHYNHVNWMVPLMIGGALGYVLSEPRRESVTYIQSESSPVIYRSNVYRTEPIYQEQWVYFNDCDCQRKVLVPVR